MSIEIQQQIKQKGLKVTQARIAVMSLLAQQSDELSVKQVYQHLYLNEQPMSLATVYRVLSDLDSAGLIGRHQMGRGEAKYALPSTSAVKVLKLKCADLSCLDHALLIESLQTVFTQFNANLLDIEFKTACPRETRVTQSALP